MKLKHLILLATAVAGFTPQAVAADLPAQQVYKAPQAVAPVANWTGWYVGAGGGYGLFDADTNSQYTVAAPVLTFSSTGTNAAGKGYFGRLQTGFDYQFANTWVAGVFGDYDFSSIKGTMTDPTATLFAGIGGGAGASVLLKQTSAWAIGGRIGYLINPQLLTFFDGGYAHAQFKGGPERTTFVGGPFAAGVATGIVLPNQSYNGYFLGGGTEYMISPGWFVKSEYRLARYGSETTAVIVGPTATVAGVASGAVTLKPVVQTVSAELVYKFNWGR
jgi:outer membrane immunogenic protein